MSHKINKTLPKMTVFNACAKKYIQVGLSLVDSGEAISPLLCIFLSITALFNEPPFASATHQH
jgi:hypothetical protein